MHQTKVRPHPSQLLEIKGGNTEDFTAAIEQFKKDRGIHFVLAFSGGADDSNPLLSYFVERIQHDDRLSDTDREQLKQLLAESKKGYVADIVRDVLGPLRGYRIAVQSGGTTWGVPAVAAEVAKEMGFPTIGVFPLTAHVRNNALPADLLDLAVCVHPFVDESRWGDEAAIYTKLLDAVIVIGGNAGTMVEVAHLLKMNESDKRPAKHIVPIYGTGGTADKLSFFPGKPDTMTRCIPRFPIKTGAEALAYLHEHTPINDAYD